MPAKRDATVFLLDVGPRMHRHLEHAGRAAADFMVAKMLHKPAHEVALVLFGSSQTRNQAHDEMREQGDDSQYLHIEEVHGFQTTSGEYLQTLLTLEGGTGRSDFVEALAVAAGMLAREEQRQCEKRVILLSNFCSPIAEDTEDDFVEDLAAKLQSHGIKLDVVDLDVPEDLEVKDEDGMEEDGGREDRSGWQATKAHNLNKLALVLAQVSHKEHVIKKAVLLPAAFKAHEVEARAFATGTLQIGSKLHIMVKVTSKAMQEKMPSPAIEAGFSAENDAPEAVAAGVARSKEWRYADPAQWGEEEIPEEEVKKAWLYGAHLIPYDNEDEHMFKFPAEPSIQLLGFVDKDQIERHQYMTYPSVMVADKARPGSIAHMAALVASMQRAGACAVLRCVLRRGGKPTLHLAAPVPATAAAPPYLLLNSLPFMEDRRDYKFPSFSKDKWRPSEAQLQAAEDLVAALDLGEGPLEALAPESLPNPHIHRLYYELGRRTVDPGAELQAHDVLEEAVLQPHLEDIEGAAEAIEAAKALFPMNQEAKAARRKKVKISTERPKEDFEKVLIDGDEEDVAEAADGVGAALLNVIFGSVGESKYQMGAELVDRLREVCVLHKLPGPFNNLLDQLCARCNADHAKLGFWQQLNRRGVKPITNDGEDEVEGSAFSTQQADAWFAQHCMDRAARAAATFTQTQGQGMTQGGSGSLFGATQPTQFF